MGQIASWVESMTWKTLIVSLVVFLPACSPAPQPSDRMIIQQQQIALVVRDPERRVLEIATALEEIGGTVIGSSVSIPVPADVEGETASAASISVRMPLEHAEQAIREIKRGGIGRPRITQTLEDVTDQYSQEHLRLGELQASEEMLSTSMQAATTTDQVAQVYEQLVEVEQEIERVKGTLLYLSSRAAFSQIDVTLLPPEAAGFLATAVP